LLESVLAEEKEEKKEREDRREGKERGDDRWPIITWRPTKQNYPAEQFDGQT